MNFKTSEEILVGSKIFITFKNNINKNKAISDISKNTQKDNWWPIDDENKSSNILIIQSGTYFQDIEGDGYTRSENYVIKYIEQLKTKKIYSKYIYDIYFETFIIVENL
jgi:hypothetical protein